MKVYGVIISLILLYVIRVTALDTLVEIEQGTLKGKISLDRNGGEFYSFLSVPYAKAPLDELRFKSPQDPEKWDGIFDATNDMPMCVQHTWTGEITGEEDCLRLNVHTPEISTDDLNPVMVFIHGGAYICGSGTGFGPEYILPEEIVLVTINYRLGVLGFLNFEDDSVGIPGNSGLKDQVAALKWIKKNIRKFGGDPDDVTIFGESAGGASVHMHMMSPLSEGLFHKGISMSGVSLNIWNTNGIRNTGPLVAETLGFKSTNGKDILKYLQDLTVEDLFKMQEGMTLILPADLPFLTGPVVETGKTEPAFLADTFTNILESGNFLKVPYILGFTDADGMFLDIISHVVHGKYNRAPLKNLVPYDLHVNDEQTKEEIANKIQQNYFGDNDIDIKRSIDLQTDLYFVVGIYKSLLYHLRHFSPDLYFYVFSADTNLNHFKRLHPTTAAYKGASHIDDLGYLFNFTPEEEIGPVEEKSIERVVKLWTNFARDGNPTPETNEIINVRWEKITQDVWNYLKIESNTLTMGQDPFSKDVLFWYDLYKNYTVDENLPSKPPRIEL